MGFLIFESVVASYICLHICPFSSEFLIVVNHVNFNTAFFSVKHLQQL